jgi:phage terminase large subunit
VNIEAAITEAFGTPTIKQAEFYSATTRYVGYGGARGGGKSHGVRVKATLMALQYPNIKILIVRRTFSDLVRLYVRPLQSAYSIFPSVVQPSYSSDGKIFTFKNAATIEFAFCANDADANNYRGLEWDVIFLDEATDYSEYSYMLFNSCIRGANKLPKRLYVTCNPGGVGHVHIKRLFITKKYKRYENPKKYTFIQARVWDNLPLLMADESFVDAFTAWKKAHKGAVIDESAIKECMYESDYVQTLANMPEDMREAHLNGNWDVFSGMFFTEWDEDAHVVNPFPIPSWWRKTASIDYGLDCFAVIWVAIDEKGTAYVYRNIEEPDLKVEYAVERFKRLTGLEKIEALYAPPDLWNRHSDSGISTAEIFASRGCPVIQSSNARESGWLNVKEYIMTEDGKGNKEGYPRMKFFKGMPINDHMPMLQHDVKKVNDVATEPHAITHSPDALRGWCSMRQLGTKKPEEIKPDPFNMRRKVKNKVNGFLMGGYGV